MGLYVLMILWVLWSARLMMNFDPLLEDQPWWKRILITVIIVVGTPVFFVEEMLEILIDLILPEEDE